MPGPINRIVPVDAPANIGTGNAGTTGGVNATLGPFYPAFPTRGRTICMKQGGTPYLHMGFEASFDDGLTWVAMFEMLTGFSIGDFTMSPGNWGAWVIAMDYPCFRAYGSGGGSDSTIACYIVGDKRTS